MLHEHGADHAATIWRDTRGAYEEFNVVCEFESSKGRIQIRLKLCDLRTGEQWSDPISIFGQAREKLIGREAHRDRLPAHLSRVQWQFCYENPAPQWLQWAALLASSDRYSGRTALGH